VEDIKNRTILHNGSTREVCKPFPRNVNAHAVLAISSLGFDKTRSVLIADPNTTVSSHHIVAKGGGATTEIIQASPIKGVTGEFTLSSVYGTVKRILIEREGLNIVKGST
jgi:aspartate dehydrogenase